MNHNFLSYVKHSKNMNVSYFQIDATNFKYESEEEEDLIELRLRNEDIFYARYSKLFKESKYFRDQYKYSEGKKYLQQEIFKVEDEYGISEDSVKLFFQLLEEEKADIRYDFYRDIYTLCKYFKSNKYKKLLDNIFKEELFSNLEFSIEILRTSIFSKSDNETEITANIEKYLSQYVNECMKLKVFGELPISTIFRIIDHSSIEKVDMTSLVDFIIESASTRFTLFKFVLLHKVEPTKIDQLINFINEQDEEKREVYSGFIGPNFSFIKEMKEKNDELSNLLKNTIEELERTRDEMKHSNDEKEEMRNKLEEGEKEKEEMRNKLEEREKEKEEMRSKLEEGEKEKEETNEKSN